MKTFYALKVSAMNGTVTMSTEVTLYESKELANKVKEAVEKANADRTFPTVFCTIQTATLFENESEVPILNK